MRRTVLGVLLLLSLTASASELYIVPAFASRVSNGTLAWYSEVFLTNPHPHTVELSMELTIGEIEPHGCRFPEYSLDFPVALAAGETRRVCMPFTAGGAFAFRASDPLIVTSEMVAFRRLGEDVVTTRQPVEPGRRWIEGGERAMIPNVRIAAPSARANLILVNPGDETISVQYRVVRVGSSPPVNHDYNAFGSVINVRARSMVMLPLPEGPAHDCRRLVPCGNAIEHEVTLESTGRFYAATSSVENELDATFRSPHVIP